MVRMVRMVRMFYEVRLSRTCFLISRRRSKPQCGSINLCNPFARSAGIFLILFFFSHPTSCPTMSRKKTSRSDQNSKHCISA